MHYFKQHLNRRQLKRSKSMLQLIIFGDGETEDDIRSKNVRQTEIMVDLREAILQVARHFQSVDPKIKVVSIIFLKQIYIDY